MANMLRLKAYCAATGSDIGLVRKCLKAGTMVAGWSGALPVKRIPLGFGRHPEANHGVWYLPDDCVLPDVMPGHGPEGFLTLKEYCAAKGRSFSTIRRYLEIGVIKAGPSGKMPIIVKMDSRKRQRESNHGTWYLPADCIAPDGLPPGRPKKQLREPIDAA